jgi:glutamate/tyrosine decarboxylase-like PLP-dependent enzyme
LSPTIYVSAEAHLAWIKIARAAGLGERAVRLVPTSDGLTLSRADLEAAVGKDVDREPLMVVGTAGTTGHGAIDDLRGIGEFASSVGAYFHVDAAWAGGALLSSSRRSLFAGIELADSVTIDPHKWLAVPMGAGLFLTREAGGLEEAFGVSTGYMPIPGPADAYARSMQWSRRFIGAKLFMTLATMGLQGYEAMIERQFALGDRLRRGLTARGWIIANSTELPLVCFEPGAWEDDAVRRIEGEIVNAGAAWISTVRLRGGLALRACITGFETDEEDVDDLMDLLDAAREGRRA